MKIKVNALDPKSIDAAIAELEKYKKSLEYKVDQLVHLLTNLGIEKARDLVPIDTGVAQASIVGYVSDEDGIGII